MLNKETCMPAAGHRGCLQSIALPGNGSQLSSKAMCPQSGAEALQTSLSMCACRSLHGLLVLRCSLTAPRRLYM